MTNKKAYKGNVIYSKDKDTLIVYDNSYVIVQDGRIVDILKDLQPDFPNENVINYEGKLIIPGFCDMHVHAPQFLQMGIGMDKELLDWLDTYTYPNEAKFKNIEHANEVYSQFVNELLRHGTLHVNCFPSIHYEASSILFKLLENKGVYAFTGKLNMDQNSPDFYIEDTNKSIEDTEKFIIEHKKSKNVTASIVPRFAITCSEELLNGLGNVSLKYNAPVHSHMCEAVNEMKICKELFPNYKNGAEIFNQNNLLGKTPTIMAHCIFMDDDVLELMKNPNCMAVHCPDATSNVNAGGIMPVKKLLDLGINLAIGSDVGGGTSLSIPRMIATTIQHSKIRNMFDNQYEAVNLQEAFFMATRSGGRYFNKVGAFDKGYHFNALIIDDFNMYGDNYSSLERLERFCYSGDDRNIIKRYIDGNEIEIKI
ncbi:amidohydrolase family protein [Sedimentibacter sp. zth1]|uniref:amidohydrolase family protein n=1 Tax=Sedimentibacter sp. zth1 TaxID=2816908 RepID=UPI001A910D25|nr:amidohydrolase family protein [Sedimentibacter sp. zth1]QSX06772.1 amidohydrolase family protein [Sedimentibacter sp. zth1]